MQIPTYERNQPVDLSGPTPLSTPQSSGLSDLGVGAARAGIALRENAEKESAIAGQNAFADFQLQQNRDFEEAAKAAPADPKGFSALFMEQYDKSMNEQLGKIPEGKGRDAFLLQAKNFRNHLDVTARGFEANRRADFKEAEGNKFGDTLSANILHDPGSFTESLQQVDQYAVNLNGFMSPDAIQKWRDKQKNNLAETHLITISDGNPQAGIDAINSGMYDGLIPSDTLAKNLSQLNGAAKTSNIVAQQQLDDAKSNELVAISRQGPDAANPSMNKLIESVFASDPERARVEIMQHDKNKEKVATAWKFTNEFYDDPAKLGKILSSVSEYANEQGAQGSKLNLIERQEVAARVEKTISDAAKALSIDSVAFFTDENNYPEMARLKKAADANPSDPVAQRQFLDALNGWQERFLMSPSERRILTVAEAKGTVARLQSTGLENPSQVPALFDQMRQRYGEDYFSKAMADLRSEKMPAIYDFIAMHPDSPYIGNLVESLKVKDEALKGLIDTPAKQADLQRAILQNDRFQAYIKDQSPFIPSGDRVGYMATTRDAVEHYSLFLMSQGQAKNYDDAVSMTMDRFGPAAVGSSGEWVFPSWVPENQRDGIDATVEQLKYVYADMVKDSPELQKLGDQFGFQNANPEERIAAVRDLILNRLVWKSSKDRSGLNPWIESADGRLVPLVDSKGNEVFHHFNQLAAPLSHQYLLNSFETGRRTFGSDDLAGLRAVGAIPRQTQRPPTFK